MFGTMSSVRELRGSILWEGGVVRLAGEGFDGVVLRRLKAGFLGWAKWLFSVRKRMDRV